MSSMPASMKQIDDRSDTLAGEGEIGLAIGDLERHAGFLLRIAQLTAFERFFEHLGSSEIRISELTVLVVVSENPGVRQGVLADFLKIKWSNMTKLVRALEERELIERHVPAHDRRSVELFLTDAGRAQVNTTVDHMSESDRKAVSMLTDEEHSQLLQLARKVAGWPPLPAKE